MKLLKKITVKTVHGKKLDGFAQDEPLGAERVVLTVYGRADKAEPGENTLPSGDISRYTKFRGDFIAFPGAMGEGDKTRSGVMILPDVAGDLLAAMCNREGANAVNFGFLIGIKKTETPIGYEYYATPLIESEEDADPLAAIAQQVSAKLPAPRSGKGKAASASAGK
ncbi:MAG: hypothetical protein GTN49_10745 [candidate division Zixibacteria bacterium]|nr:hypothetical protein [candidate division Zixibacteria bacterium]